MESEKVKDIKKALECWQESVMLSTDENYVSHRVTNREILDYINELESENERLKIVVDIANERTYRKKFIDEWRKEYQKELDKQGNGHIAGYPDFDLVYKLYFEQKDRIAELEKHIERVEIERIRIKQDRDKKDELASKFIDSYNDSLKQFAERLIEKCEWNRKQYCCEATVSANDIDETLKEFI